MPAIASQVLDDELSFERVESFGGGEDSFRRATLLDPDQCQKLVNIIVRETMEARTRPGADALGGAPVSAGAVQALKYFDTPTKQQLLNVVNGKFYKYEAGVWTDLSGIWQPSAADNRVAMAQGVDTVLISDGQANLRTYNGTTITDCGAGVNDPPKGATILCWHTGRMFAAGVSTSPDTISVSNRLAFGAGQWNAVTRSFRVGYGDGDPILALASMQQFVLAVLKRNSIWLTVTDPRNDAIDFSSSDVDNGDLLADGIGIVGRDAWCRYGNDLLFFSQDGVRSIQRMQAATGQWQLSAPLSQPIQPLIDRVNQAAWGKIVAKKFKEFAMFFVPIDGSAVNNAVLVYNGRLNKWLGLWTNWNGIAAEVTRFLGNNALVFGDAAGRVNQWKDLGDITTDATYLDNGAGYPSTVWVRAFAFGDLVSDKSGYNVVARFSAGAADITLSWVADNAVTKTWTSQAQPDGDILGVNTLPFKLASQTPVKVTQDVRELPAFNEAYVRVETQQGWFRLKNITASAFINPLNEET
jgi:hypothetical protein